MYFDTIRQMQKQLVQMDTWLAAAAAHAATNKVDANVFPGLRLALDQFPLSRQVQIACDTAKLAAARVTGRDAPVHPDTEQTIDELRARIKAVVGYLDGFTAKDFDGVEGRTVSQPRWEGQIMTAHDYFLEHALPNFYFHLTHVYAILRHYGVGVGKKEYLGALTKRMP